MTISGRVSLGTALLFAILAPSAKLPGQVSLNVASLRSVATVALVHHLPIKQGRLIAVIVRSVDLTSRDIILLPSTASAVELDAATRTLMHARATPGLHPSSLHGKAVHSMMIGVNPSRPPL